MARGVLRRADLAKEHREKLERLAFLKQEIERTRQQKIRESEERARLRQKEEREAELKQIEGHFIVDMDTMATLKDTVVINMYEKVQVRVAEVTKRAKKVTV